MSEVTRDIGPLIHDAARNLPPHVHAVCAQLQRAGHQAHLVGGCVRDVMLGRDPSDWDVATDARPQQVLDLFEKAVPTGFAFGTVTVVEGGRPVEVTTFRKEFAYTDGRRPVAVVFARRIEDDLARRDFTINAMAYDVQTGRLWDPFAGASDLQTGSIRAVGKPSERFREDALRMLRAVRFSAQLGFTIEPDTWRSIETNAHRVGLLSLERIRDELLKLLAAPGVREGLWTLYELGLFFRILPEMRGADRLPQGKPGAPDLLSHAIQAAGACPPDPVLRLAALLHDVGKLATRRVVPDSGRVVFHGHETAGAELAAAACRRLRLPGEASRRVVELVRRHMLDGAAVGPRAVRRLLGRFGEAWVRDLIHLRRADHIASGHTDINPSADRLSALLDEAVAEAGATTIQELAVDGHDVMRVLGIGPGPAVGRVLRAMFERVLDDPAQNDREALLRLLRKEGLAWVQDEAPEP